MNSTEKLLRGYLHRFDTYWARVLRLAPNRFKHVCAALAYASSPIAWGTVFAVTIAIYVTHGKVPSAMTALIIFLLIPSILIIKNLFKRTRPRHETMISNMVYSSSFPSAHAYSSALGGGYFVLLGWQYLPLWGSILVMLGLLLFSFSVGLSRIVLKVHYPSDVVAGWLLGLIALVIAFLISPIFALSTTI